MKLVFLLSYQSVTSSEELGEPLKLNLNRLLRFLNPNSEQEINWENFKRVLILIVKRDFGDARNLPYVA
jgi:hypothetical protein